MRRAVAILVAGAVGLLGLLGTARPAGAADTSGAAVQLLSQTPWLEGPGLYSFDLDLSAFSTSDRVEVTVYDQMRTRSGFQQAAAGRIDDRSFYQLAVPISALAPDGPGGYGLQLPVNEAPSPGNPVSSPVQIGETGVFPVELSVVDANGDVVGKPLVTFIVYVLQTQSAGQIAPLSAAVVIPVSTPPAIGPDGALGAPSVAEASRLAQLAVVLNADSSVPASLLASPLTLDELSSGPVGTDQKALSELSASTVAGPFEVLPSTYSPISLGDLSQAGLGSEIQPQIDTGAATLAAVLGSRPDARTWVVNGPLGASTLSALIAQHATQLIVPDSDLTSLSNEVQITFGRSTDLTYDGSTIQVMAADPGLTADFNRSSSPVLAANQLLAELAMIYTEAPNAVGGRAVAVMPPPGWSVSPVLVQTLLAGLHGNPLVSATTASSLFSAVGSAEGSRDLSEPNPALSPAAQSLSVDSLRILETRADIADLGHVFSNEASQVESLDKRLLLAETASFTDQQRRAVLAGISAATAGVQKAVALPPDTSITLTSSEAEIPLTILTVGNVRPQVQLRLTSQRLIFRPYVPPNGNCTVVTETTEVCTLSLTTENTTLKVPVETRSSGVFPLDVKLYPPDTPLNSTRPALASSQDTLRSTAVSGMALILIAVALFGLVLWWGRDLRRGRRPKRMVPAPDVEPGSLPAGSNGNEVRIGGPIVRRPPSRADRGVSPSAAVGGPSATTDTYGPGRETRE